MLTVTDPTALVPEVPEQCGAFALDILTNPSTSNKAPVSKSVSSPEGRFVSVIFVPLDSPGFLCCSTNTANDRTTSEKYI